MSDPPQPLGPFGGFDLSQMLRFLQSDGPVHWEIARQVARWVALEGDSEPAVPAADRARLSEVAAAAEQRVLAETGEAPPSRPLALLGRAEWADQALVTLKPVLEKLSVSLQGELPDLSAEDLGDMPNPFAAMFGMLFVVSALRNTAWGVLAVFGFTFVSGVMLAPMLQYAAGLRNGGQLVALAGGMTAAVFLVMATIATVSKRDFSFLGKFLFVGLILLIIASLANIFFQVPVASIAISAIAVMIFSLYLLYDVSAIVRGGQTNYIMATLALFLDIFNIFVNLLNLLLIFSGQRD